MTTGVETSPQPDMKHKIEDGVLVITPEGSWLSDEAGEPVFERLSYALATGNKLVLFNLSRLTYMNSSGLNQLLIASSKIKEAGGKMALCCVPAHTQKLLQITRLENMLNKLPDEQDGIRFLKTINP